MTQRNDYPFHFVGHMRPTPMHSGGSYKIRYTPFCSSKRRTSWNGPTGHWSNDYVARSVGARVRLRFLLALLVTVLVALAVTA